MNTKSLHALLCPGLVWLLKAWFHERFFSAKCELFRLFLLNCDHSNKLFLLDCSQFKRNICRSKRDKISSLHIYIKLFVEYIKLLVEYIKLLVEYIKLLVEYIKLLCWIHQVALLNTYAVPNATKYQVYIFTSSTGGPILPCVINYVISLYK
jgi:hypothetical protein